MKRLREDFNNKWLLLFFVCKCEVHLGSWYSWVIRATPNFCSTALRHLVYDLTVCSAITCLNSELIGPSSTAQALTYIFLLSHTFSSVSLLDGILDPSMSLSSFCSLFHPSWLPDCLSPPLPLAIVYWIKHCWSLSQQICRLHKICLLSFYPITEGSSKLIKAWVRQMLHLISFFF